MAKKEFIGAYTVPEYEPMAMKSRWMVAGSQASHLSSSWELTYIMIHKQEADRVH